jgi:GTPase SAR1 family protein
MGCNGSSEQKNLTPGEQAKLKEEREKNRDVEKKLEQAQEQEKMILKLLLLGAGESGKSTLFKQMISIYGTGFTEYERRNTYLRIIHANSIASIKMLCQQSINYGPVASNLEPSKKLIDDLKGDEELSPALAAHIAALWADPGIQATYAQRHKYQLTDSTKYFLDKVKEIAQENYLPSEQDVLRSRVRTTGIVSNEFIIDGNKFQMYDVGGQRNERKKWIHCFEGVTAVLFVAAISEYDQMLYEDETMNRVTEALILFEEICNSRWFKKTSMILFLNKCDIFADKIKQVPLTVCFPDYAGTNDYKECADFMQKQFEKRNHVTEPGKQESKKIYTHVTCATDKNNVHAVFNAVKDIIIRGSLEAAGLIS